MSSRGRLSATTLLVLLIMLTAWSVLGSFSYKSARREDFMNLYTGASLARDHQYDRMYLRDVQLAREREYAPGIIRLVPFNRPPFYAALISPMAWMPLPTAQVVWLLLNLSVLAACTLWAYRRFGQEALVIAALFFPTSAGIPHGQDCVFLLAIFLASYQFAEREQDGWAGAILGLGLFKFHLLLAFPLVLLGQRRWRMMAAFSAVGAAEAAVTLAIAGTAGVRHYVEFLAGKVTADGVVSPEMMANLYSLPANFGIYLPPLNAALGLAMLLSTAWVARKPQPLWRWYSLAIIASLLVAPHAYPYDGAVLLLPLWLAYFSDGGARVMKAAVAVVACPVVWILCVAPPPLGAIPALSIVGLWTILWQEARREAGQHSLMLPQTLTSAS